MPITNRPAIKNFFIVSASLSEIVDTKISRLSLQARQARYARDYNRLAVIGNELIDLSARSEDVGRYYQSIAEHRLGLREFNEKLFEELSSRSSLPVRAASTLALGVQLFQNGNLDDALRLYQGAYELCVKSNASITTIHALTDLSQLVSSNGSHGESLGLLRAIHPAVCQWGRLFPLLLGEQFNNTAYELYKTGELACAQYAINKACSLPIARNYPEWFETKLEIEEKLGEKPSRSMIFVPHSYESKRVLIEPVETEKEAERQPVPIRKVQPIRQPLIAIETTRMGYTAVIQRFPLHGGAGIEDIIVELVMGIDELPQPDDEAHSITVRVQLFEGEKKYNETEYQIAASALVDLLDHLENVADLFTCQNVSVGEGPSEVGWQFAFEQAKRVLTMIEEEEEKLWLEGNAAC